MLTRNKIQTPPRSQHLGDADDRLKFVSLYAGCGGMDLGFLSEKFECIGAYDNDPHAIENYKHNIGKHIYSADLSTIDQDIINLVKQADLLVAGPPCQGFSTAGKNNPNDPRNLHLLRVSELAIASLPEIVVVENVRGLLGKRHEDIWLRFKSNLINAGYNVNWAILNTNEYEVPQIRKRIIIVATRNKFFEFPTKSNARLPTLIDVINNRIKDSKNHNPEYLEENSDSVQIASKIQPGQKLSNVRGGAAAVHTWDIPEVYGAVDNQQRKVLETIVSLRRKLRVRDFGDADPVSVDSVSDALGYNAKRDMLSLLKLGYLRKVDDKYDLSNTFNGKYRRLSLNEPSLTVDTRFGQPRYFLHPNENRGFTIREAARIQTFPEWYEFIGNKTNCYKLVGNAVPPTFAAFIARAVKQAFETPE